MECGGETIQDLYRKFWVASGVEHDVWCGNMGCSRHLEPIEQVQLRALRMFFGVGTLHSKASLLREGREVKMRCVKIWLKVLNYEMYEERLLRKIARRAVECSKGVWVKYMAKLCWLVRVARYRRSAIKSLTDTQRVGIYMLPPGTISGDPWLKKSASVGFQEQSLTKQAAFV